MEFPDDLRYMESHEWARAEEGRARMGITDYAQDALGDIVYVTLPEVGAQVSKGEAFCEVESTKSVSDIYAPVSGTIVEVNTALDDAPQKVNDAPYGDGWICVIEMSDSAELDTLLDAAGYQALLEQD